MPPTALRMARRSNCGRRISNSGGLQAGGPLRRHVADQEECAEGQHQRGGRNLQPAQGKGAIAGPAGRKARCQCFGPDRQRGDRRHRNGGSQSHHEGRDHSGPEQSLSQGEDQNEYGAGTRAQAYGDDRGQPTAPSARPGEFLRLRRMRMSPGRSMVMMMIMPMPMLVRTMSEMMFMPVVVVAMITMRVMMMIVALRGGRHGRSDRRRLAFHSAQGADQPASFDPQ